MFLLKASSFNKNFLFKFRNILFGKMENNSICETQDFKRNENLGENNLRNESKFKIVNQLGRGSFGEVYKVKHIETDKE